MPPHVAFSDLAATLPGEGDILASVLANPADDTAKLVYADWLEERDDPRGKLLRECVTAFRAGKKFPSVKSTPKPWRDLVGISITANMLDTPLLKRADTILSLARPTVVFDSVRVAEAKIPVGASKFGGGPDLPAETKWPCYDEEPLAFLAQFSLAELSASVACRELPSSGLLSVFVAYDEDDGNDDFPKGTWRLLYTPGGKKLIRCLPPDPSFNPCRLKFTETLDLPDRHSPWSKQIGLDKSDEYDSAFGCLVDDSRYGHKLLGYPVGIQGDVLNKKTMLHLLTLIGDSKAGWEWGDGGSLFFTLSQTDLAAHRFDRIRFEMECA